MSDMVERVALALFNDLRGRRGIKVPILRHEGLPYEAGFEDNRDWLMEVAGVAIEAMRVPNVGVLSVGAPGCPQMTPTQLLAVWTRMIDEALKP